MNEDEKRAFAYLKNCGFKKICYESDGNVPPDFVVDDRIAIEVRRLNQQVNRGGVASKGIEEDRIPLYDRMKSYFKKLGPGNFQGQGFYVCYDFARPVSDWKDIKIELDRVFKPLISNPPKKKCSFELMTKAEFKVDIIPAKNPMSQMYKLVAFNDLQHCGFTLGEIYKSLYYSINGKDKKITKYLANYPEWWLIMPNHVILSVSTEDQSYFRKYFTIPSSNFQKIVVLNLQGSSREFQIYP